MSQNFVDLEDIVLNWAMRMHTINIDGGKPVEIKPSDIDWTEVRIRHESAVYTDQRASSSPKTQILFTANFINDTDRPQVFKLKSERRTTSVCNISMEKGFTKGIELELKLQPPNPVVEANAGFKGEVSIKDSNCETFEEQMLWSINNDIKVPPKMKITAELVLTEVEYQCKFTCRTRIEGTVAVLLKTKNPKTWDISTNIKELFRSDMGFVQDVSGAYYTSSGECKCRFGLEQHVKLHQTSI